MKFGMCIVKSFKTAFERQIGEAVKISSEKRKGTMLLNSKAEYNRCSIPRITTKSQNFILEEKKLEDAEDNAYKDVLRAMKNEKRIRKLERKLKEDLENQPTLKKLKNICVEISNENVTNWKIRRENEKRERLKQDEIDHENIEK